MLCCSNLEEKKRRDNLVSTDWPSGDDLACSPGEYLLAHPTITPPTITNALAIVTAKRAGLLRASRHLTTEQRRAGRLAEHTRGVRIDWDFWDTTETDLAEQISACDRRVSFLRSVRTLVAQRIRESKRPLLTVCPACGRSFGRHAVLVAAEWFVSGVLPDEALVHLGCRYKPRKSYPVNHTTPTPVAADVG